MLPRLMWQYSINLLSNHIHLHTFIVSIPQINRPLFSYFELKCKKEKFYADVKKLKTLDSLICFFKFDFISYTNY